MTPGHDGAAPQALPDRAPPAGAATFTADPDAGRLFTSSRAVRATDVTARERLRLDAIARYLQEAAEDDIADARWDEPYDWLLRKCTVTIVAYPKLGDLVRLRTFCSALGPRWAERTTTLSVAGADVVQARALWVALARQTGAPAPLSPLFLRVFGASAGQRTVSARLSHGRPGSGIASRPWPLRACDFGTAGHVNNTVHWAAVEDALSGFDWRPQSAELEYHRPILPGSEPVLMTGHSPGRLNVWLTVGGSVLASARLASARLPNARAREQLT